jgi:hypothetical protein
LALAGLMGAFLWLRRRQPIASDVAPLTQEETSRLAGLMRETDG